MSHALDVLMPYEYIDLRMAFAGRGSCANGRNNSQKGVEGYLPTGRCKTWSAADAVSLDERPPRVLTYVLSRFTALALDIGSVCVFKQQCIPLSFCVSERSN